MKNHLEDPGKRSRLWFHEDIFNVLHNHIGKRLMHFYLHMHLHI
jgi:hypothetical protein